jgi:hypothetical protein
VIVDPPADVGVCVTVGVVWDSDDCEVGVCDDEGVEELEVMGVEEELDDWEVLILEDEEVLMGRLLDEVVEESEVETGVGLLLAIELDGIEELAGAGGAVDDGARGEVVLVELELDIVNCLLKTSFLVYLEAAMSVRKNLIERCK